MDQTTVVNATTEYFNSEIAKRDERIKQLEEAHATAIQRSYTESAERNRMRNEVREFVIEQLECDEMSESTAESLADICGFELTTEFELEVTVQYSITVNARDEESAHNIIHGIDFDTVSYNSDDVTWLSSTVDSIDS